MTDYLPLFYNPSTKDIPARQAINGLAVTLNEYFASIGYTPATPLPTFPPKNPLGPYPTPTPTPTPTPGLTGFALNGSTNPKLRAMMTRRYGVIDLKGDSTSVGQGGGTNADPRGISGARVNRPSSVFASIMRNAGYLAYDDAAYGDVGLTASLGSAQNALYAAYDPRIAQSGAYMINADQTEPGGAVLHLGDDVSNSQYYEFTPDRPVDTFDIYLFGGGKPMTVAIDHANPASVTLDGAAVANPTFNIPAISNGIHRVRVTAASVGTHTLDFASVGAYFSGVRCFNSAQQIIDIRNHAACSATTANQAASGNGYKNLDFIGFDAPDFTIANLTINDMATGVAPATSVANLQAILTQSKVSGDALLVCPHPIDYSVATLATQQANRDALAALAAQNNVAFMSLFDYFGGAFTPALAARMFDGKVHGNAGFYAEVAQVYDSCRQMMTA